MKYKYPKKITVGCTTFKIIYDYTWEGGAEFNYPDGNKKAFVRFGLKDFESDKNMLLHYVIHEFKEIIQIEQSSRLFNPGSSNFKFFYDHSEHSDLCSRLTRIIMEFIK